MRCRSRSLTDGCSEIISGSHSRIWSLRSHYPLKRASDPRRSVHIRNNARTRFCCTQYCLCFRLPFFHYELDLITLLKFWSQCITGGLFNIPRKMSPVCGSNNCMGLASDITPNIKFPRYRTPRLCTFKLPIIRRTISAGPIMLRLPCGTFYTLTIKIQIRY